MMSDVYIWLGKGEGNASNIGSGVLSNALHSRMMNVLLVISNFMLNYF